MKDDLAGVDPRGVLNADERRTAKFVADACRVPEGRMTGDGAAYADFSTPLMEIQSSIMPLSIVFDCVAYLDRDHTEVEMFDMIQRLKKACE